MKDLVYKLLQEKNVVPVLAALGVACLFAYLLCV